ncbi:MAG: hypothetical protein EAZ92_12090 [Candidatus Kapaibacterium sp.]|nr:MAG: hypothetical protein EAZ92_12090 [Candidatus Kapabacteria bacterium]
MKNKKISSTNHTANMKIFSIVLIVLSNVVYQLSQKSVPEGAHPLVATIVSYCAALLVCIALFVIMPLPQNNLQTSIGQVLSAEVQKLNWSSYALGISIVGVEIGFLLAYRAGWNISIGALLANSLLMMILVPVGVFLFREDISWSKVCGILLCLVGSILIAKK